MKIKNSKDVIEGWEDRTTMKEKCDCTVRALATALAIPYRAAHKLAELYGRKPKQGMNSWDWYRMLGELEQAEAIKMMPKNETQRYYKSTDRYRRMKLSTFTQVHNTGTYILDLRAHATSVVNGVVVESHGYAKDQYVLAAWKVETDDCNLM